MALREVLLIAFSCFLAVQGQRVSQDTPIMNTTHVMEWTWQTLMKLYNNSFPNTEPTGKFYDAALEITNAVAQAHAAAQRSPDIGVDLKELSKYMQLASAKKNIPHARSVLARTLYRYFKLYLENPDKPLKMEAISFAASQFLETLKDDIGLKMFDNLFARRGGKTLAFAVDTTGSMTDDIKATKAIAKAIVQESRKDKVDYILSPFGDPTYGPVTYKSEDEGKGFINALDSIAPRGGGDCEELAFKGILEALNSGPQYGSPLFVITDASAKDASETNIKTAKVIAQSTGITINFFTKYSGCDHSGISKFRDLAGFTGGQVFPLKSDLELKELTSFVRESLETTQILSTSRLYDAKRRVGRSIKARRYPLYVDNFVLKLRLAVTTEKDSKGLIQLVDPDGKVSNPTTALDRIAIYSVSNPASGKWMLVVPKEVGKFDYIARVKSDKIIQFGFYFVLIHNGISSPIPYPVVDEMSTMYITLGGSHHTDTSSLTLRLINHQGQTLMKDIKLVPLGSLGVHFKASFVPPGKATFKVVLEGNTKEGTQFTRVAKGDVTAKGLLLIALYGQGDFIAKPGKPMMLVLGLHNSEGTELFRLKAFSAYGKLKILRSRIVGRKGRMGFSTLFFVPKMNVQHGSTITLFVIARGERSGRIISDIIRLIAVRPEQFV